MACRKPQSEHRYYYNLLQTDEVAILIVSQEFSKKITMRYYVTFASIKCLYGKNNICRVS